METQKDFWKMVWDIHASSIVMLDHVQHKVNFTILIKNKQKSVTLAN